MKISKKRGKSKSREKEAKKIKLLRVLENFSKPQTKQEWSKIYLELSNSYDSELLKETMIQTYGKFEDYNNEINQGKFVEIRRRGAPVIKIEEVVNELMGLYNFITIFGCRSEEVYVFKEGIYVPKGREKIKTTAEDILGEHSTTRDINEIFEKIKRLTAMPREAFDNIPEHLIPLQNCIYDIKKNRTIEYSPKYLFTYKLPVDFIKSAKCPNFEKYLKKTISPDDILCVQEWFGFCIYRKYFIKKGMIWVGDPDTGKTVLVIVLSKFVGHDNTSGITLQRIANNDKFALAALHKKFLNYFDDLEDKDLNSTGGFKVATGGGTITAEYKFGDSFQFRNFAKLLFACNKIPPIKDVDDKAYYDRWLLIEFENIVPKNKQDNFLADKLTTPEELSGILNWALEGLKRLLKNGKFTYNKSKDEVRRIMERSGDTLAGFAQDCLIEKEGLKITKDKMYEIYSIWAKAKNLTRSTKGYIGRNLGKYAPFVIAKRENDRFWYGSDINWENIEKTFAQNKDTLDAFLKIKGNYIYSSNKIDKKESNPPKNKEDTLDAFSKKEESK